MKTHAFHSRGLQTCCVAGFRVGRSGRSAAAFTLLELLTVIAIIGIIAAITIPNLKSFKPNVMAAGTSQLLGDVARARQMAISQRTTVYMIFVPPNFWADYQCDTSLPPDEREKARSLLDKQMVGYNYVSLRRLGSQPGERSPDYLSEWRTLPEGVIIVPDKFGIRSPANPRYVTNYSGEAFVFRGFERTKDNGIAVPFPSPLATNTGFRVPYLAFNYLGQLESGEDEVIPLALGGVGFPRDAARKVTTAAVNPAENPPNNSVDSYSLIRIDWLTGRARVERQEIR